MNHVPHLNALASRLYQLRAGLGLSQAQLAAAAGCSAAYLSRVESADRQPSVQLLGALALHLHTSVRYLTHGEHDATELGLGEARLTIADLTDIERDLLEEQIETATFAAARDAGLEIRRRRDAATVVGDRLGDGRDASSSPRRDATEAEIADEPDGVLTSMAAGDLDVSDTTRHLAQAELDHREARRSRS